MVMTALLVSAALSASVGTVESGLIPCQAVTIDGAVIGFRIERRTINGVAQIRLAPTQDSGWPRQATEFIAELSTSSGFPVGQGEQRLFVAVNEAGLGEAAFGVELYQAVGDDRRLPIASGICPLSGPAASRPATFPSSSIDALNDSNTRQTHCYFLAADGRRSVADYGMRDQDAVIVPLDHAIWSHTLRLPLMDALGAPSTKIVRMTNFHALNADDRPGLPVGTAALYLDSLINRGVVLIDLSRTGIRHGPRQIDPAAVGICLAEPA